MALPHIIEYLLALQRPDGGPLLFAGVNQILIPAFPPNTTLTWQRGPFGADYAIIMYETWLSPSMVPGAFSGWGQQWGATQFSAVLTSEWLSYIMSGYVTATQAEPSIFSLTNETALVQYYSQSAAFLNIATPEDYNLLLEAIARVGTSARSEQLAQEAVQLLRILTGGAPAPQPPIGES